MYHKLNYIIYRRILGYYSGERDEDAFGKISISRKTKNILFLFLIRHAKSFVSRCQQKILSTNSTSRSTRRFSR